MSQKLKPETLARKILEEQSKAKDAQKKATEYIGQLIPALTENPKPEGQETFEIPGFKIVLYTKINRNLDQDKWEEIMGKVPEDRQPVLMITTIKGEVSEELLGLINSEIDPRDLKRKYELEDKGVKWLQKNDKDSYKIVAQAITTKPAKSSIDIIPTEAL